MIKKLFLANWKQWVENTIFLFDVYLLARINLQKTFKIHIRLSPIYFSIHNSCKHQLLANEKEKENGNIKKSNKPLKGSILVSQGIFAIFFCVRTFWGRIGLGDSRRGRWLLPHKSLFCGVVPFFREILPCLSFFFFLFRLMWDFFLDE